MISRRLAECELPYCERYDYVALSIYKEILAWCTQTKAGREWNVETERAKKRSFRCVWVIEGREFGTSHR